MIYAYKYIKESQSIFVMTFKDRIPSFVKRDKDFIITKELPFDYTKTETGVIVKGNYDKNFNRIVGKKDREAKKQELKQIKQEALTRPIKINGKLFYSSEKAYNEYKLDYEAGLDVGITQGEVLCVGAGGKPIKTIVTKEELEEYFKRFRARKYKVTMYYEELIKQVDEATSLEEVKKIEWVYPKNYTK